MSLLMSAATLKHAHDLETKFMDKTATIWRTPSGSDGMGGNGGPPANIGTTICRIEETHSASIQPQGGAVVSVIGYKIIVPSETVAYAGDEFVVDSRRFRIDNAINPPSYNTQNQLYAQEVV